MLRSGLSSRVAIVIVTCLMAVGVGASAQELTTDSSDVAPRDTGTFIIFTGVDGLSSCSNLRLTYFRNRPEQMYIVSQVFYDGAKIVEGVFDYAPVYGAASFGFGYRNDRGSAVNVDPYPLTPGKPIDFFMTAFTPDWQPLYEARARLKSCDATELKSESHGPAYQLLDNHSFELAGIDETYTFDETKAALWKGGYLAGHVQRFCLSGGAASFVGDCTLVFDDMVGQPVTKIKQTYNGTVGTAGDGAYLLAHAGTSAYGGGGKIIAKLTLTTGAIVKLTRKFDPGTYGFGYPFDAFAVLPAPIRSAKVIINQKSTTGTIALDAITLSVFTNTNPLPRALPLPEA
jgi:hypothetical protein